MANVEATATQEAATTTSSPTADRAARLARAETLVKDHMLMSAAVGLIPAPGFDLLAGIGVQLALLKRLTTVYGIPFSEKAGRGIIMSLLAGVGTGALGGGLFFSAVKLVPGLGTLFGVASMPIAMGAVTYALGQVFIAHLELGGTLADFDARANRRYFRDLVQRGRQVAANITATTPTSTKQSTGL
jgi:uncharacterized protein (DUF697 family)